MNKLPRVAMFGCNPNISLANATTEIHIKGGKKKTASFRDWLPITLEKWCLVLH